MNKLMYRFVDTRKKKKKRKRKKEIDPFLDTVCPLGASRVMKSIILFFFVIAITTASSTTVQKAIKSLEATLERKFDQLIAAVKGNAPEKLGNFCRDYRYE